MQLTTQERRFNLPFHVVKRLDTPKRQYWAIKIAGFLVALLLTGIICTILRPGTFLTFYQQMFLGCFDPSDIEVIFELLETIAILLLITFALAPVFKMKFWNIGAEGQILVGCLATAGLSKFLPSSLGNAGIILICLVVSIAAGIIWALIPALFKAFFNTNETLFTLMMNYVAMGIIALCINIWVPSGSQVFGRLTQGGLPNLFGMKYVINIIVTVLVVTLMIIYLKKTKHGYELSVVGESVNTARYVGINVRKVIIRTMILSGAICGLVGFLLVAGHHHTLSTGLAGGKGFTGVLIAWLGGFNPGQMILYATLVGIFDCGSRHAASTIGMSTSQFSAIVTGIFFLVVIASEFFVNYQIKRKVKEGEEAPKKADHSLEVPSYEAEKKEEVKEEAKVEEVKPLPVEEVKPEEKKPEAKKAPSKKSSSKKEEPKKAEPKKVEAKKEAPKKAETKKAEPKKEKAPKEAKKPSKVQENKAKPAAKAKTNKSSKEAK